MRSYSTVEQAIWNIDGNRELLIGHGRGEVEIAKRQLMPPPMRAGLTSEPEKWIPFLTLPYWFVVGVSCFLTASPWLLWRFRPRTLLIATTLVAVVLGLAVWAASK